MLIISKFIDYYDSVAHSKGVDKTIVYKRDQKDFEEDLSQFQAAKKTWYDSGTSLPTYNWYHGHIFNSPKYEAKAFLVGFCGKIYPGAYIHNTKDNVEEFVYGYDNVLEAFKNLYKVEKKGRYKNDFKPREFDFMTRLMNSDLLKEMFARNKTPIFLIDTSSSNSFVEPNNSRNNKNVLINPCLKGLEFYKQMDPFMAFQEIEMYISGVLGIDSQKTLEVSDKSKIEGHGFDYKWSFRKEKQNKK